ncbi:MAG TPA: monovalent cation:proton antiporter-2 (CPA2) family protein [Acetobacteraceae bacterium]|nr:monovalent cation:proton antiporter-2 (CPA2) family protein [Acetobacteraceae bacterium]
MLDTLVVLLAAATLAVPLTRRAGFGSVLGYLLAGLVIGPGGLRLITDVQAISSIAELGVVMLLFLIGLEVRPQRLWVMRRSVFGLGTAQVFLTGAALAGLAYAFGLAWQGSVVLGAGFALSSTAIVLPLLAERDLLRTPAGRDGFAVLLFQDIAFIPLVAIAPLLSSSEVPDHIPWLDVARGVAAIAVILVGGRFLLRPLFRAIGGARTPEVFTIVALLVVAAAASIATAGGLSPSLGAFMAGVLLSESEYRHELQADIEPFEGLLLGFFFISVGMSVDLALARAQPLLILAATVALLLVKSAIAFVLGRLARQDNVSALRFAAALPQASEFSFVLFDAAVAAGAMTAANRSIATLVTAASMLATPILFAGTEAGIARLRRAPRPEYDTIDAGPTPVIIAGFGRFGQIIGRVLRMHGIEFTALERDPGQVEVVRRFGTKVYFGDPTRLDMLRAAGAETAKLIIVSLDNPPDVLRIVEAVKRYFPNLAILARARNRWYAHLLMDREVDGLVRETFHSSLKLAQQALITLGIDEEAAQHAVTLFRERDEKMLIETHAIYRDEKQLIQSQQQAADELASLFETDRP